MTDINTSRPIDGRYYEALRAVLTEIERARARFAPMASAHEGYAILLEEVDEMWDEIKGNKRDMGVYLTAVEREAVQVAAMAVCLMVEVCNPPAGVT